MRRFFLKLLVAALTFTVGTTVTALRELGRAEPKPRVAAAVPVYPNPPVTYFSEPEDDGPTMPESLSPRDIEFFINQHPGADLAIIWRELGLKDNGGGDSLTKCGTCQAETFFYDLDHEPGNEAVLKISDRMGQIARFLVFKAINTRNQWKPVGHADVWGKYIEPYHMILLSGGKPWLVIRGQGASGSGVALYIDYIFQVSGGRLRQIAAYSAEGHQSGAPDGATRQFTARPVSCEVVNGWSVVELDLYVVYSIFDPESRAYPELFARRQRAALVRKVSGDLSDSSVLDSSGSDLSQREFDSVYNIDSLYAEDFVKYNLAELSRIAVGRNRVQKEWLREYLKTCESTAEVRKLRRMVAE